MGCQNCDEATEILIPDSSPCPQPCGDGCKEEIDSSCVIYHQPNTSPTQLENINLPNGSSVEEILEKIDDIIGNSFAGDNGTSGTSGDSGSSGLDGTTGTSGTSGVDGVATSGFYSPDYDITTNADTVITFPAQYLQVGDVVTVSGKISITSTTAGMVSVGFSLPIESDFEFDYQAGGTAVSADTDSRPAVVIADETNDLARIIWTATGSSEIHIFFYHFTYLIVGSD